MALPKSHSYSSHGEGLHRLQPGRTEAVGQDLSPWGDAHHVPYTLVHMDFLCSYLELSEVLGYSDPKEATQQRFCCLELQGDVVRRRKQTPSTQGTAVTGD